ncbi:MAG: hypothetical protein GY756_06730 [bacterium]|nr:hypothetical protein [bacterium]
MKILPIIVVTLLISISAYARLGDTIKQCNKKYGEPVKKTTNFDHPLYLYLKSDYIVGVTYSDKNIAIEISYTHLDGGRSIPQKDIKHFLKINSDNSKFYKKKTNKFKSSDVYINSLNYIGIYNKKEHVLTIINNKFSKYFLGVDLKDKAIQSH